MFKEFFNSLMINSNNDSDNIHETGMLSLTAIFIRIAKLDGVFDKEELKVIRAFLKKRYKILIINRNSNPLHTRIMAKSSYIVK